MENEKLREIKLTKAAKYTILTTFLLGVLGVGIIGISTNGDEVSEVVSDGVVEKEEEKEEEIVVIAEEKMILPFKVNAQIKTYYYDLNDEASQREKALIYYNGSYTPSNGVDYFYNNNNFEIISSFSGKVIEKVVDPMYGLTVLVEHENGLVASYSSLTDVPLKVGDIVKQGEVIGKAGNNTINSNMGNHLNFSLLKNGKYINPLGSISKNIKDI